ncbi:unnamed protein product [Rotaria sp. Silwood2]|nr:unnamed protein product [Rotaria sp. Silwood2]
MKFGEHLTAHVTPEWSSQYIEYEYMKELLEQAIAEAPVVINNVDNRLREQFFRDVDVSFFQFCEKQATKIGIFFAEKLAEALRRFESLKDELQYIKSDDRRSSNRRVSIIFDHGMNEVANGNSNTTGLENSTSRQSWIGSFSNVVSRRLVKKTPERSSEQKHYKSLSNLKAAFSEFYLMLVLLQNYQVLNFTGFRKILKKHDKIFQTTRGDEWR